MIRIYGLARKECSGEQEEKQSGGDSARNQPPELIAERAGAAPEGFIISRQRV